MSSQEEFIKLAIEVWETKPDIHIEFYSDKLHRCIDVREYVGHCKILASYNEETRENDTYKLHQYLES